jgi:hypothetical protein
LNAQQRRRLKRIRQRQQEAAERRLTRGDVTFVLAHTPAAKNVCVMSDAESQKHQDVKIWHRCTSTSHRHYTRKHVDILVQRGELQWVGGHHRIAAWTQHRTWQKVDSVGPTGEFKVPCMQLVAGAGRR